MPPLVETLLDVNWFNVVFTRDIPPEMRLAAFSGPHLAWVAGCGIVLALACWRLARIAKADSERAWRIVFKLSIAALGGYIVPVVIMCSFDSQSKWLDNLPLHVCSAAAFMLPFAIWKRSPVLLSLVYGLCLPAAIVAILTPEAFYQEFSYLGFYYLLFNISHSLIALVGLGIVVSGGFQPRWRNYPAVIAITAALMALDYPVNKALGTNYMFVNWPEPGTILELFAEIAGNPGYVFVLIGFGAFVVAFMFALYPLAARGRQLLSRNSAV
ncbi:MAG: TIGR02206 family membrane protein [Propionibacteriaceae bacterium]|jgi:hypothetical integral membrane protein (TIGR02206 family)|nr:TIGR02206 family membrane protein [Propionibacteriaceae bacterium]